MRYVVDRIEGKFAVIEGENGEMTGVELARLPYGAEEGSVLYHEAGYWGLDAKETAERRQKMRVKMESLWEGNGEKP